MGIQQIDVALMQKLFLAGAKNLEANKEYINELNVFPVPDGDTGTNMTMTIMSAAKKVNGLENPSLDELCKAISSGSLVGARGNSGVILSQLLRGLTKSLSESGSVTVSTMAQAFQKATETAYKAVMKPKEGTILTVAKGAAERALELANETDDFYVFISETLKKMEEVLAYTPELLPVLKEAGVVDSGGQGLVEVIRGINDCLNGKEFNFDDVPANASASSEVKPRGAASDDISTADIKFGYCTEFIIMLEKEYTMATEFAFKEFLESIGDSIVVVSDDGVVKVHVHTNDPGLAIQRALTYGSLTRMKIDNMREEHNERLFEAANQAKGEEAQAPAPVAKKKEEKKPFGFVAVSIGDGLNEIFENVGVDVVIAGGQTMNPSTEDVLNAVEEVNAEVVYVLPNNKNIILAANQAQALCEDTKVVVVPSKNVPQGISAMIAFSEEATPEENLAAMQEAMQLVKTGQVTYAVRDTSIEGVEIHQGNIMGIGDKGLLAVGEDISYVTAVVADKLIDDECGLLSIYYGEEVDIQEAEALAAIIENAHPDIEVEVHNGGQPIYYYVLSAE